MDKWDIFMKFANSNIGGVCGLLSGLLIGFYIFKLITERRNPFK